jgi:hypothetical protein
MLVLTVHVDNCILTGSNNDLITQYKSKLDACHMLTDLGPVHWLLGIKITRDRSARTISVIAGTCTSQEDSWGHG